MKTTIASGREVTECPRSFLATWRPSGGLTRVVIQKEMDVSWWILLSTDRYASVQVGHDSWIIEANYSDLN